MRGFSVCLCLIAAVLAGCHTNHLPPAPMLAQPGPGVGGPGPGVIAPICPGPPCGAMPSSQVAFVGPEGMTVQWDVCVPGSFDSQPLVAPGRYEFPQGAIYRLKITNLPGQPGIELYPTIEVGPALPRSAAFLAHNAIPVQFTQEDLDQVLSGNFVTKVIYLPDPQFQQLALAGVETLVSTRLDPGVDPIVEADRRGAILMIARLGNKDLQLPGAAVRPGGVFQASYNAAMIGHGGHHGCPMPCGVCAAPAPGLPAGYVAGVTGPQYGMPITGTPIGLPGPPHVPLGVPAGLQRHVIVNHTKVHIPPPTEQVKIDVKQTPGISYPASPDHVRIVEHAHAGHASFHDDCHKEKACAPGPEGPAAMPCPGPGPYGAVPGAVYGSGLPGCATAQ
jgi:hypothetical protein